jgi:hypothetical protein
LTKNADAIGGARALQGTLVRSPTALSPPAGLRRLPCGSLPASSRREYLPPHAVACPVSRVGVGIVANSEHLAWLKEGVEAWNERRTDVACPDLSGADLRGAALRGANLQGVNLQLANLTEAILEDVNLVRASLFVAQAGGANFLGTNLERADLQGALLAGAILVGANLRGAYLPDAKLTGADLSGADLSDADLSWAVLEGARLVGTYLEGANLTYCRVYGISAWDLMVDDNTKQANLIITPSHEPEVSVDNLKVAQFVYLILTNPEIREVIDTVAKKTVLILGYFGDKRKPVLTALRDALRLRGYVPILFDFEGPASRDLTETVSTLARLARFVIADLTDARSIGHELSHFIPDLPSVPVQPLILEGQREYGMFEHWVRYPWVLTPYTFADQEALLSVLSERVITPAEAKANELVPPKR